MMAAAKSKNSGLALKWRIHRGDGDRGLKKENNGYSHWVLKKGAGSGVLW